VRQRLFATVAVQKQDPKSTGVDITDPRRHDAITFDFDGNYRAHGNWNFLKQQEPRPGWRKVRNGAVMRFTTDFGERGQFHRPTPVLAPQRRVSVPQREQ
jgi:hypothetical protein